MYLNKCYKIYINFLANAKIPNKNYNSKINPLKITIINLKLKTKNNFPLLYKNLPFIKIFIFIIFKNFDFYKFLLF